MDFRITSLIFSGGEKITLDPGDVLILVGPNNSGKSVCLREIGTWFTPAHQRTPPVVLESLEVSNVGTAELFDFVRQFFPIRDLGNNRLVATFGGGRTHDFPSNIGLEHLYTIFYSALVQRLDTETRLLNTNPAQRLDILGGEVPTAGIHWLQKDEELYKKVNAVIRKALGADIVINWGGGSSIGFHFGDEPSRSPDEDRISPSYLKKLNLLPRIEQTGDGIRSFVASVIAAYIGPHPVLLIDEPEAFLHPPQAKRLGQAISSLIGEQQRQAIIATHSPEFIRGALSGSRRVTICRIERNEGVNHARRLDGAQVDALWSSPLLRSSHAITGIFSEGVVICEADADARFYESLLQCVGNEFSRPTDLYFMNGSGKGAIATLARAYRGLGVKTAVIADIDLLKNQTEFNTVYATLGGDPKAVAAIYSSATKQLGDQGAILSVEEFQKQFSSLLAEIEKDKRLTSEIKRRANELIENAADWSEAKKHGVDKLRGGARREAKELLDECQRVGLFLVPGGELESWWRDGPATKKDWIIDAIQHLGRQQNDFNEAIRFVKTICVYFGYRPK